MRRPQASEEKRSHATLCRIRCLIKGTSVCIVDKAGKVIREVKVATEPVAIFAVLTEEALAIERIGLEAGPLSQWLYSALAEAGLPVICVETRHMKAALSAQINKSDRTPHHRLPRRAQMRQRSVPRRERQP
jgi:transposase